MAERKAFRDSATGRFITSAVARFLGNDRTQRETLPSGHEDPRIAIDRHYKGRGTPVPCELDPELRVALGRTALELAVAIGKDVRAGQMTYDCDHVAAVTLDNGNLLFLTVCVHKGAQR